MNAYVYALQGLPESLQPLTEGLGQPICHWVANMVRLTMGAGVPKDWQEQGAVFGPRGELRWWRDHSSYGVLLLTDEPVESLSPLPGNWTAREEHFLLQNLCDRSLQPNFCLYPYGNMDGRCRCMVYYNNGIAAFVSLRELLKGGNNDANE